MSRILARQERRTDLAEYELFVLGEFRTLGVVVHTLTWYVTRDAFDANHCGFPLEMRIFTGTGILILKVFRGCTAPTLQYRPTTQ
ncbi:hypothetical protein D9M73_297050 [compost metagenome]